ncbi:hypothetical protein [Burkholderia vietnamiensis]|nr:hypothetical protein [Burkholderia vietnamiensis]
MLTFIEQMKAGPVRRQAAAVLEAEPPRRGGFLVWLLRRHPSERQDPIKAVQWKSGVLQAASILVEGFLIGWVAGDVLATMPLLLRVVAVAVMFVAWFLLHVLAFGWRAFSHAKAGACGPDVPRAREVNIGRVSWYVVLPPLRPMGHLYGLIKVL